MPSLSEETISEETIKEITKMLVEKAIPRLIADKKLKSDVYA